MGQFALRGPSAGPCENGMSEGSGFVKGSLRVAETILGWVGLGNERVGARVIGSSLLVKEREGGQGRAVGPPRGKP